MCSLGRRIVSLKDEKYDGAEIADSGGAFCFLSRTKNSVDGVWNASGNFITETPPTKSANTRPTKDFAYAKDRVRKVLGYLTEDWVFLALLGTVMALLSMAIDITIESLQTWHVSMLDYMDRNTRGASNIATTYAVWVSYAVSLVFMSAAFVHYVAPQAIGSGIPEMKTILRGVILKEYLTFRTLVAKMVGLTLSLGSGMPLGKEGPFVHMASVLANLLSYFVKSFHGIYANESRSSEMLVAACAVGVSSTFSAPVGGVLFSIEVTSVYFAVRNYWRGFFAAACSATLFRLFRVYFNKEQVTVEALYPTSFPPEAFLPEEIPIFASIGFACGLFAATYIYFQRSMVLFLRRNRYAKRLFQKHWMIYPIMISFLIASVTYPKGFGRFLAGEKKFSQTARDFFDTCSWTLSMWNVSTAQNSCSQQLLDSWSGRLTTDSADFVPHNVFINLICFFLVYFIISPLTITLPIPSGVSAPTLMLGASFGRMVGELMTVIYPTGLRGADQLQIYPGIYAVVGAAAFCGGVTHTVSVAVIIFEETGQLVYILPVMIAIIIANAVCSYFQPSIYDTIIRIKHLPYLPDIPHASSSFHGIRVEQFMTRGVRFLSRQSTYRDAQSILHDAPHIKAIPIVESKANMILIGSCSRAKLLRCVYDKVGPIARQEEAHRRIKAAVQLCDLKLQQTGGDVTFLINGVDDDEEEWGKDFAPPTELDRRMLENMDVSKTLRPPPTKKFTVVSVSEEENRQREMHALAMHQEVAKSSGTKAERPHSQVSQRARRLYRRRNGFSAGSVAVLSDDDDGTGGGKPLPPLLEVVKKSKMSTTWSESHLQVATPSHAKHRSLRNSLTVPIMALAKHHHYNRHHHQKGCRHNFTNDDSTGHDPNSTHSSNSSTPDVYSTIGDVLKSLTRLSFARIGHRSSSFDDLSCDLHGDERRAWEAEHLAQAVDFDSLGVDPAPFQLVEHSSLYKVHSLFSLLGLNRAYVTRCGRLIGVVALRDVRIAIERVQSGQLVGLPTTFLPFTTNLQSAMECGVVNGVSAMAMSGGASAAAAVVRRSIDMGVGASLSDEFKKRKAAVAKDLEMSTSMRRPTRRSSTLTTTAVEDEAEDVGIRTHNFDKNCSSTLENGEDCGDSCSSDEEYSSSSSANDDLLTPCPKVLDHNNDEDEDAVKVELYGDEEADSDRKGHHRCRRKRKMRRESNSIKAREVGAMGAVVPVAVSGMIGMLARSGAFVTCGSTAEPEDRRLGENDSRISGIRRCSVSNDAAVQPIPSRRSIIFTQHERDPDKTQSP